MLRSGFIMITFGLLLCSSKVYAKMENLSTVPCLTWVAPQSLSQAYEERLLWELRKFDQVDWENSECQNRLKIELKPMMSRWYLRYEFNQSSVLTKDYANLEEWVNQLPKDLARVMPGLQTKLAWDETSRDAMPWNLLSSDAQNNWGVGIYSQQFLLPNSPQGVSGIEIAFSKSLGAWQSYTALGFGVSPQGLSKTQLLNSTTNSAPLTIKGTAHLSLGVEKSLFPEGLHSPFWNVGVSIDGLLIELPEKWKGEGLCVIPELELGAGWRGFRASDFDFGGVVSFNLPLSTVEFLDVENKKLHSVYPLSLSLKVNMGF